jgi:hypothetical protein
MLDEFMKGVGVMTVRNDRWRTAETVRFAVLVAGKAPAAHGACAPEAFEQSEAIMDFYQQLAETARAGWQ